MRNVLTIYLILTTCLAIIEEAKLLRLQKYDKEKVNFEEAQPIIE
jgi:hypothetical protein